jgi:hypothetical protein
MPYETTVFRRVAGGENVVTVVYGYMGWKN